MYGRAVATHSDGGHFSSAGKFCIETAEVFEEEKSYSDAATFYMKAVDFYEATNGMDLY